MYIYAHIHIHEGELNEKLKYFYPVIYWIQKEYNDFISFYVVSIATCRPLFKPSVSLFSPYKTIELWFEFLANF